MPLRLKETLPVIEKLKKENIFAMTEERAEHQDIRQLKIAVLNLMPDKESTELQLLRLLSNSPLQIEVTFIRLVTHQYKNTPASYLLNNYQPFRGGVIIPGVKLSYGALAAGTSLLPDVAILPPKKVVGSNTVDCMRSGAVYGTAAMIDGMVERMEEELGYACKVIATGSLARDIIPCCRRPGILVDNELLLRGLWTLYQKNR